MCSKVTCRICDKPTWSGCGQHIESALAGIPKNQRCQGHSADEIASAPKQSWIKNLFNR